MAFDVLLSVGRGGPHMLPLSAPDGQILPDHVVQRVGDVGAVVREDVASKVADLINQSINQSINQYSAERVL